MAAGDLVAAIDIGTTKVVAVVGELDAHGSFYVIGHGESPAEGFRKGVVIDMEKAGASIRKAVDDAQLVSGTEIDRVTVGIAGEHIRTITSTGVVALHRASGEVTAADMQKAVDAARTVTLPVDREMIHVLPQQYSVDGQDGIRDPRGMRGSRLEVEVQIVTASVTTAQNIYRAVERCRLEVEHLVLESVALVGVLPTAAEQQAGVILIDLGGDVTTVSTVLDGALKYTATIPLGGRNVTNDIAVGLRTQLDTAERLKMAHGAALAGRVDPEEIITIPAGAGKEPRDISRNVLASIIEPRVEEIFSMVARDLKRAGFGTVALGGVVLAGGGSLLPGSAELAEHIFDLPCRVGAASGVEHVPDDMNSPRYATALGLLVYGFTNEPVMGGRSGPMRRMMRKFEHWIARQF